MKKEKPLAWYMKLRRLFSRSEWVRRLLHLPYSKGDQRVGLIVVQIDGLSRRQFERGMKQRKMPFLRKLHNKRRYRLYTHYSGVPSTTPCVQGEILYGVPCAVPAFDFYAHEDGTYQNMLDSMSAQRIQSRLEEQCPGALVNGGSAYSDIYTGGADEAHFCASRFGWADRFKPANPAVMAIVFGLYFTIFFRIFFLVLLEIGLGVYDLIRGIRQKRDAREEWIMVLQRVGINIALREWQTLSAIIDIARGVPVIHLNYLGYDEHSHRRGPASKFAHWSLKGIDGSIRQLWRAAHRSSQRKYDLWVYSDHGHEHVIPYRHIMGESLHETFRKLLEPFGYTLVEQRAHVSSAAEGKVKWMRKERPFDRRAEAPKDPSETAVALTCLGPMGHVYFNHVLTPDKRDALIDAIFKATCTPAILYCDKDDSAWIVTREDRYHLPEEAARYFGEDYPLAHEVGPDLVRLANSKDAGALVLLCWQPGAKPITFAIEHGAHGGIGVNEVQGFALIPQDAPFEIRPGDYIRPVELHNAIARFRHKHSCAVDDIVSLPKPSEHAPLIEELLPPQPDADKEPAKPVAAMTAT